MSRDRIEVAAGILQDEAGRVLISRRPAHAHQGGRWEFPGGKLRSGETPEQGLRRELWEELGVRVQAQEPLIAIPHDYEDRRIRLRVFRVQQFTGTPRGREGQALRWAALETLHPADFPAADRPVLCALQLPRCYLITGEDPRQPEAFLGRLQTCLAQGLRLVQLRAHRLSDGDYAQLAARAHACCQAYGARLLLNRDPRRVRDLPQDGLHLSSAQLRNCSDRPVAPSQLLGVSCHTAEELQRAAALGADYALLSPVLPTATHPDAKPLGWEQFRQLVQQATLPVYALGGVGPQHLSTAIQCGAQGIAAIRSLWFLEQGSPTPCPAH